MRAKRDMDLVRLLLLAAEGDEQAEKDLEGYPQNLRHYHATMLIDEDFVYGTYNSSAYRFQGLTWSGHEFIDTVRNSEIWMVTKEQAKKAGVWTLGFLAQVAVAEGKRRLGLE